jgi:hypothetical protein
VAIGTPGEEQQQLQAAWPSARTSSSGRSADPERSLLESIANGELDDHLVAIGDAVHARRHLLLTVRSATALAELCVGDSVRINHTVSPRYLHGLHGTIVEIDDRVATVRLQRPVGRFRSGQIRCPALALDKLPRAN